MIGINPSECPIPNAKGFCEPEGMGSNGVLILGEALGDAEAKDSLPFRPYAPAGALLERAIRKCGFSRTQFVLWNVVPVQPPHNYLEGAPYEGEAIAWGMPMLQEVIERYKVSADGGMLEAAVTVDDPDTFNEPLHMVKRWRRVDNPMRETVCAENNGDRFSKNLFPIPQADEPDF